MLICLSADYRRTPIPILEQLERRTHEIALQLDGRDDVRGSVVLATCNRFEAYVEVPGGSRGTAAAALLADLSFVAGIETETLSAGLGRFTDEVAAEHLFAVASGLESAAVGEGEIAGQVRRAHSDAREAGRVTHLLERLFQSAHRVARDVKHRTALQGEGRSLVRLALLLAERRIDSWRDARVLLVGTGAYAGATVAALRERGAKRIAVHSPSGRAAGFADARGIGAVAPDGFPAALASADLLIACSAVKDPLITPKDLAEIPDRSRLFLDLGMPRNIDPDVTGILGTELLDIEAISRHAPVPELSAEAEARRLVRGAAEEFSADRAEREAVPTLVILREHVLGILEEELCRARSRRPGDPSAAEGDPEKSPDPDVESALRHFTGRLLHEPSERIRALGRAGRAEEARIAAEALFGLEAR
ncbi:glutamyl-tRNA reductase [Leucobacter sp. CSA2]|uniref:Glutamyl-tRNA reductase n=1 Tax=Leucobacter edaphi TaxID=2796472 RepID=A0A934QCT2_9MICO|nr:glutamyl-tRNA reductase [Leucobacter edaphi]MBK0422265.1 glutamyl-tRNA reductase [Leucobacter edaphi]